MDNSGAFYSVFHVGECLGAIWFQGFGFFRCAIPYLYFSTFADHGADEIGAEEAHAQKCDHCFLGKGTDGCPYQLKVSEIWMKGP